MLLHCNNDNYYARELIYTLLPQYSNMKEPFRVDIQAYETIEKVVANGGNSGRVFVPKTWKGKRVRVLLLEPVTEEDQ